MAVKTAEVIARKRAIKELEAAGFNEAASYLKNL